MELKHKIISLISIAFGTSMTFAAGVGELAQNWAGTASSLQVVLVIGAALVGLATMASGAIQLKKHADNPQQNPMNKGIIFLAAGALLFGLSATSTTMLDTVFGTGATTGSTKVSSEF